MSELELNESTIFYRNPYLYDEVTDTTSKTRVCEHLIATYTKGATTLLDLGCGTARDVEYFAKNYACVGVDIQSHMVDYVRRTRPEIDIRVGDITEFRAENTFDVIVCLGNTLSYLRTDTELTRAFATFAAHAHPGTLLIIAAPVSAATPPSLPTSRGSLGGTPVTVTTHYSWNPASHLHGRNLSSAMT